MLKFKRFLTQYFMAAMYVVSDEGGGDFVIDEPETPEVPEPKETPDTPEVPEPKETPETPEVPEPKEPSKASAADEALVAAALEKMGFKGTMEQIQGFMEEQQNNALVAKETATLQAKYPDFSKEEVTEYLNELNKTDSARAEMLNNPIGWENVYLNMQIERGDGVFMPVRGVSKEPFDFEKSSKLAEEGNDKAKMDLFDNIK